MRTGRHLYRFLFPRSVSVMGVHDEAESEYADSQANSHRRKLGTCIVVDVLGPGRVAAHGYALRESGWTLVRHSILQGQQQIMP